MLGTNELERERERERESKIIYDTTKCFAVKIVKNMFFSLFHKFSICNEDTLCCYKEPKPTFALALATMFASAKVVNISLQNKRFLKNLKLYTRLFHLKNTFFIEQGIF